MRIIMVIATFLVICISVQAETISIKNHHSALLVIDMQNDFTQANGKMPLDLEKIEKMVIVINKLSRIFKENGKPVIYISNTWKNPLRGIFFGFAGKEGTWGAEIDSRIEIFDNVKFNKSMPSSFSSDSFLNYLKEHDIDTLYVTGVKADGCIFATIKEGNKLGYKIYAVLDGIGSSDKKSEDKAFEKYKKSGIVTINSDEIKQ